MAYVVEHRGREQTASHQAAFYEWLELRVRRVGNCGAVKLWAAIGASLFAAWIPALSGLPL